MLDLVEFIETNQHHLNGVIDLLPIPIFIKDTDGKYIACNFAFEEFSQLKREQLIGKSVFDLWNKDQAQVFHNKDMELFSNPGEQIYETEVDISEFDKYNIQFHKTTFRDLDGKLAGLVGVVFDITAKVELEKNLEILAIKEKENVYKATVSSTQHILNNFLNQLTLVNREINKNPTFDKEVAKKFKSMTEQATNLVAKLASVQKIEAEEIKKSVYPK